MCAAVTKPDAYGIRELSYFMRENKTEEKRQGGYSEGRMRLALYEAYEASPKDSIKFLYSFSDTLRNPFYMGKQYGGEAVTFRWLYALLSDKSAYGESFLDRYFSVDIYYRLESEVAKVYRTLNRRDSRGRYISGYAQKTELGNFGAVVRRDCSDYLHEGNMGTVSEATLRKRESAGISGSSLFIATGQLINDMTVTVALNTGVRNG